ncbi:MAG: ADP-ribosylglycohydrolase family protein [Clostridia bacterium]|nr:ADP-ribosylglycohydrolase family protein [Clostridia bacterium]
MFGAIFGDIVGAMYEFDNIKTKDFDIYNPSTFFTDDTVMTLAIAQALMDNFDHYSDLSERAIARMRELGQKYSCVEYGPGFHRWLTHECMGPYDSCGNGAAMRVSSVGWLARSIEECEDLSEKVTAVTHNHFEGIKGAEATAVCVFLARHKKTKEQIREYVEANYYDLDETVDQIRARKTNFDAVCQETVPQAIICFLESTDFEDCIRNAISIGGDSDTLSAIAGSIAEAYYGMTQKQIDFVLQFLPDDLKEIVLSLSKVIRKSIWIEKRLDKSASECGLIVNKIIIRKLNGLSNRTFETNKTFAELKPAELNIESSIINEAFRFIFLGNDIAEGDVTIMCNGKVIRRQVNNEVSHLKMNYREVSLSRYKQIIQLLLPKEEVMMPNTNIDITAIDTYVAFDNEFNTFTDDRELILLDALKFIKGKKKGKFHSLIKPTKPLLKEAEVLTGITNAKLNKCPHPIEDILPIFNTYVDDNPIVCSHASFVNKVFEKYQDILPNYFSAKIIDIKDITERIFPSEQCFTDSKMALFYNIGKGIGGVFLINEIFEKIKKLVTTIGTKEINITQEQLKQILKMKEISTIALQKNFNWSYSKANGIMSYLQTCGFCNK